ncbi:MAG TPA: hypothetical protein PLJ47_00465 [Candidatus Hydrogenedentes bacterium]|nr:hypothetical protein [Candidatus Hydrogenedentota bacterium]
MLIQKAVASLGKPTSRKLALRKAALHEESARTIGGMLEEIIDARERPNRWRTLPRREGVLLRARQIELMRREDELLKSAETLAQWALEDSQGLG